MVHKRSYSVKEIIQIVFMSWTNRKKKKKKDIFLCYELKFFFEWRKGRKASLGDIAR